MRLRALIVALAALPFFLAILSSSPCVNASASPAQSLDGGWSDALLSKSGDDSSAFDVIHADQLDASDDMNFDDAPDYVKHLMQATGNSGGVTPSALSVSQVNATVSQCVPSPVNIPGIAFSDANNATLGAIDVTVGLIPFSTTAPVNNGSLGLLTIQHISGLTFSTAASGVATIQFQAANVNIANLALASLIYTPAQGLQGTFGQVLLEVQGQGSTDSTAIAISLSLISFNQSNYTPVAIIPIDAQSFTNLTATINQTISIPAISVSSLANPLDQLVVSIQITNGRIVFSSTTGLTFQPSTNPEVVNFVGLVADVNSALASLNFTALCPTGASCSTIEIAGFSLTVRDLSNNTECPVVSFYNVILNVYPGNVSVVEAAVPAPFVTIIDANTVNVTWQSVESTNWSPSAYQPAPTSYALSITTNASAQGFTTVFNGLAYTYIIANLTAATSYTVQVEIYNPAGLSLCPGITANGRSVCQPNPTTFTTPNQVPGPAIVLVTGSTSNSITFSAAPSSNDSVNALVATVSSPNGTIGGLIIIPVTVAGGLVVEVITGLDPFTNYLIEVQARNSAGLGPVTAVSKYTELAGPAIVGFVASDPTNTGNAVSDNDEITITFSELTNQPSVTTQSAIDALLAFSSPIGSSYSGLWLDAQTLQLTLTSVGTATPTVGILTVQVVGQLTNAAGSSDVSKSSAVLTGNWGLRGLSGWFITPVSPVTVAENGQTYLGVSLNFSSAQLADQVSSYLLSVQVLSPLLSGVSLNGSSALWSTGGIFVSSTGTAATVSSALSALLLTPPRSYFGPVSLQFTISQILSGSSKLLGELVSVITVTHVNHPPAIVAPSSLVVPLEQTVLLTGLAVSDVDVSVGSLTDSASLTLSVSNSGLLSFAGSAQAGVVYAPSFSGSHTSVQVTGPLMLVNLALQQLQVNFEYATSHFGAPAQYLLAISINDHGNGGNPILITTQIVSFNISCLSDASGVQPVEFTTAELSATGNQILLALSLPVDAAVLASPFVSCSSVFSSVASFGSGALCHWVSSSEMAVELGQSSTVTVNDLLNVQANYFQRCQGTTANSTVRVTRSSTSYLAPIAISGPSIGSLCEDLTLMAVTFASSAHELTYSWSLPGSIASSSQVTGLDLSSSVITIPVAAFNEFTSLPPKFTFSLTVTNFLGQSQSDTFDVVFNTGTKPLIQPLTPTTVFVNSGDALNLAAIASVPSCATAEIAGADALSVVYSWTSAPEIVGLSLGSASILSLPTGTLEYSVNAQHAYTFTLQAALSSNENYFAIQAFTVVVQQASLVARIDGGAVRTVSQNSAFGINASTCYDSDATSATLASEYTYTWSCETVAPFGACYTTTGELLTLTTSPIVAIAADQLAPNSYIVTVVYAHIPTGRSASTSQTIVVSESSLADNSLALELPVMVINTGDQLSATATSTVPVTFEWSIIGAGPANRFVQPASSVNSTSSISSLVLAPSMLESGAYYGINVRAIDADGDVTFSSSAVYVNAAPICSQSFAASPSSGTAMSTGFELTIPASSCFDSDATQEDQILFRFFRSDSLTGLKYWLSSATPESTLTNVLLPTGAAVIVGVRVLDARGSYNEYSTTLSVSAPQLSTSSQYLAVYTNSIQIATQVQDSVTIAARVGSFVSTVLSSSLNAGDMMTLKDLALQDLLAQAPALIDDAVTPLIALIVRDASSTSVSAANYSLQFVESLGTGTATIEDLESILLIVDGVFGVVANGQGSSASGGARRRLLATSLDSLTLNVLNTKLFASLNSISTDVSSQLLTVSGDRVPLNGASFSGLIQRGVVGSDSLSLTVSGSTVTVPSTNSAFAPIGALYDVSLISTPSSDFAYLALTGQVANVYFFGAYQPAPLASPLAPHIEPSTPITQIPASVNASITLDIAFQSALAGSCINTVDALTGAICSLECRRWNGTGFDTTGVLTNFNALNNLTFTAQCIVSQPGAFTLFRSLEVGLVLSSTGSQAPSSSGSSVDQTDAVRASLAFPSPFVITNMRDFKSGLVNDLSAMSGEASSRFTVEQVTTNTASGVTTVIIDIWVPTPGSLQATAQDVYENLASLSVTDVLSTTFLRLADLSSWQEQCSDMVFRASCSGTSSDSSSSWMLPLIISASAAGFLLCCALVVLTARRYWSAPSKEDKSLDDGFVLPSAAGSQAKQYIYSPPIAGKEIDAEISRDEQVSDVTIVSSSTGIDPHSQSGADDEISEPVIVESEAEAAELAKNPELMAQVSRSAMDAIHEDEDSLHELSVNSASASGQSRHFYYVDESRREESQSRSSSVSESLAMSQSRSASTSISQARPSKSSSHFRIAGLGGAAASAEPSFSSRPAASSTSSQRGGAGAHFRYSDNEDSVSVSRTPSLPSLGSQNHSPSHSAIETPVDTAAAFQTLSHLELAGAESSVKLEKRAVRVVRPGQSS